jgi:hypothetical protein
LDAVAAVAEDDSVVVLDEGPAIVLRVDLNWGWW